MEINEIKNKMSAFEKSIKEKAHQIRTDPNTTLKISKLSKIPLNFSVCAVDGGLLTYRFHAIDVFVIRSIGVNFTYNGKLESCEYFPSKNLAPKYEYKSDLDETEDGAAASLLRLEDELTCAMASIEKFRPKVLLLDGSLNIHPSSRKSKNDKLSESELKIQDLFTRLFERAKALQVVVCGVIKDSRSKKLANSLNIDCSDSYLCNYLLQKGERTKSTNGENGASFFYLKVSDYDLPLRIEHVSDHDEEFVASLIFTLSSISKSFTYPAVLVEADMRAALNPKEINLDFIRPLRRNARPFR